MLKVIFVSRQIGTIPSVWDVICVNGAHVQSSVFSIKLMKLAVCFRCGLFLYDGWWVNETGIAQSGATTKGYTKEGLHARVPVLYVKPLATWWL